jgi:DNA (cytosine-5)-methyltransferase 1
MTFGSLFAGIGGLDLGLERAGMKCVWQVELEEYCRRVLAKHWPDVRRHGDVRTFPPEGDWSCDLICGGPPCQATSGIAALHGKRTGETLWPEMYRVLQIVQPRFVVVEQPIAGREWEDSVKADLAAAGYRTWKLQRRAREFGAPHSRRRVFFVAHTLRQRCDSWVWGRKPSAATETAWPTPPRGTWRTPGTGHRRVDDGVSHWVDRVRALGNSVVPQVAEWIGRRIMEAQTCSTSSAT